MGLHIINKIHNATFILRKINKFLCIIQLYFMVSLFFYFSLQYFNIIQMYIFLIKVVI